MRRLHLLKNRFACRSPKIPLLPLLLVPYVLLVVGTVGLVEYLCVRERQRAIQNLAEQLTIGVGDRVNHYLEDYLETLQSIQRLNSSAIRLGQVDITNPKSLERHFLQQIQAFERVSRTRFSNPQGGLIAVGNDGGVTIASTDGFVKGTLRVHGIDNQGNRTKLLVEQQNYDASQRPFHQIALKAGKPTWSQIYVDVPAAKGLAIAASYPLYDEAHRLQGVLSSDLMLAAIDKFLDQLKIGTRGTVFIVERSGLLVASATGEPSATNVGSRQTRRLAATASNQIQIRQTAEHLFAHFHDLTKIDTPAQLHFEVEGERQFLQVNPFRDRFGLDWLIVVTLPEADFTSQMNANTRTTILLTAGVLAGAIALGLSIAHYITRSIRQLSQASRALARGKWERAQEDSAIAELEVLARAFNQMAAQLQRSFQRVNTALQESQEKFATIFRSSPDAICIIALPQECYLEVNDRFLELTGYSRQEIVGRPAFELNPFDNPLLVGWLRHPIEMQQTIRNLEFDFRTQSGQTRTALLSVEVVKLEGQRCLLFLFKDITARKSLEIALQRSNAKLNDILNSMLVSATSMRLFPNGDWEYEYWSQGCEAVFGYTARELMADKNLWRSRVFPEDGECLIEKNPNDYLAWGTHAFEYRFYHQDGSIRWISEYATSRWDAVANCWLVTIVNVDITERKQLEIALQRSEAKLNHILNTAIASICCLRAYADYTWEYDFWSEGCEAVFGYTAVEFMADRHLWASRVLPEDMNNILMPKFDSLLAEQSITCEYRFFHKDGTLRWISATCNSRRDAALDCWIVTTVAMDITARRQAEAALRQSEERWQLALQGTKDAIWDRNLITNTHFLSLRCMEMLGYEFAEIDTFDKWTNVVHPDDRASMQATFQQHLRQETPQYIAEYRIKCKNGSYKWILVRGQAVWDRQGKPIRAVGSISDISDRKQTEEALRNSEERFREAFANAPIGMALVSLNGHFLKVNRSLCKIVGYSETELLALGDREITHPDDLEIDREAIRQMLAGKIRFHQTEKRYLHKQGNTVQILWSVSLAIDGDRQPLYFISQVQDITERQAIDRMKDELISIVSHELRTPLTAICGSLGLVATGIYDRKPEKAKRMIEMALIDSERLTRLIDRMLDIERLDSGSVQMVMEVCAAGDLMQRAVETIQAIAAQHAILLSFTPTLARVWATPDYILQVLTNLLDNAIKFSPPNSTVWLSAEVVSQEWCQAKRQPSQVEGVSVVANDYVLFQVKDRGRGIPADKLQSIFGRFQQVDVSDSRQKGGTGLGLAICKSIVQQHGGSIWVESTVGEGSTFYFTLPTPNS